MSVYNICCPQGVLDKIRMKIQKLEKAIQAQREHCKEPCTTKCPIPVVSGMAVFAIGRLLEKFLHFSLQMQDAMIPFLSVQVGNARTFTVEEEKIPSCT